MTPASTEMRVVRLTIDLFRAVPLAPLGVETHVLREGRRIQVVSASLVAGRVEVGRAVALKVRKTDLGDDEPILGTADRGVAVRPGPADLPPLDWRGYFGEEDSLVRFHTHGVEIRTVDNSFLERTVGMSWFRLKQPLVEGEEVTPFQRAAIVADLANGNAQALDPRRWLYVNPDITLYLHRRPIGEWLGMRSQVYQSANGIGLTDTELFDQERNVGHINQAQLLDRR